MKRAAELRDLSEDHHHGLVLARNAKQAAAAAREGCPVSKALRVPIIMDVKLES